MGTSYDCMDPRAATQHPAIKGFRLRNRLRLKRTLERVGFEYYAKEWWHFTLRDEPYPEKYFNFPVARDSVK
jgi:D-alanyl-D-alanine dipeptidase